MEIEIRPIRSSDAADISRLRRTPGVFENTLGLPSTRVEESEKYLSGLGNSDFLFAATVDGVFAGYAGLHVNGHPRLSHSGSLGILVDVPYQGMGIGRRLMTQLLDIADNWLMLVRVELTVFTDNERAVALYKKMGFVEEGIKRYAAKRGGIYTDEYIMARYRNLPAQLQEQER